MDLRAYLDLGAYVAFAENRTGPFGDFLVIWIAVSRNTDDAPKFAPMPSVVAKRFLPIHPKGRNR